MNFISVKEAVKGAPQEMFKGVLQEAIRETIILGKQEALRKLERKPL